MGISCYLRRVTPAQLEALERDPDLDRVQGFLFFGEDQPDSMAASAHDGSGPDPLTLPREEGDALDLDRSWHMVHHLLTGSAEPTGGPLGLLIEEWPVLNEGEEGGISPISVIGSDALATFLASADALDANDVRSRFHPDAMIAGDVYMAEALAGDGKDMFAYVSANFEALRRFVAGCVQRRCGALCYMM